MPKTDHERILTQLSHHAKDPKRRRNIDQFVRSLSSGDREDRLTCQECAKLLPEYLQAAQTGEAEQERWQIVAFHLGACPHCADEYAELSALMAYGTGEQGVDPPFYPAPDLSFLRREAKAEDHTATGPWHFDELGRLIIRLADALFPPPSHLAPAYAVRNAVERSTADDEADTLGRLSLGRPAFEDLQVDVTVLPDERDAALCVVVARVEVPSRWPLVAGTEVTLAAGDKISTQLTNESGEATFRDVAISMLDTATLRIKVVE